MTRHRPHLAAILAATTIALTASADEIARAKTSAKPIPPALADLPDRWRGAMEHFLSPGFAVVAVEDDEVIYLDAFGERDPQRKLPVTPDTIFYIASATKPFNAMAILTLVDDGKIELDAPVKRYLPRFELAEPGSADKITIRDLLSHKAGVRGGGVVFLDAYTGEITDDRYYYFLRENGSAAGTTRYSNVHYTLLGRVIEAVTGKTWQEYLIEQILRPAGMHNTTPYATAMYQSENVAIPQAHTKDGSFRAADTRKSDETMHAAGGLGTTARDLGQWLKLNINRGVVDGKRIVSKKMMDEMLKMQSTTEPRQRMFSRLGFGLGWQRGKFGDYETAHHGGGYIGAVTHTSFLIKENIGVGVLGHATGPAGTIVFEIVPPDIYNRLLVTNAEDKLPEFKRMSEERMPRYLAERETQTPDFGTTNLSLPGSAYAGIFEEKYWGTLRVSTTGDLLNVRWGQLAAHFEPADGNDSFVLKTARNDEFPGRFLIESGKVVGVFLDNYELRFTRVDESK